MSVKNSKAHYFCIFLITLFCLSCSSGKTELDRFIGNEDWDGILTAYKDADSLRTIDIAYANIALATKGQLADKAFNYIQVGPEGLFPDWQLTSTEGKILAYILYEAGHVSLAQKMAFETDVNCAPAHDGNMLKMLVKTNLIYGNWVVAEKYICFLEREGGRNAEWASEQRKFLGNPDAVADDPEYGPRRKCMPEEGFVTFRRGYDADLKDIIKANPTYRNAVDILGVYYLLCLDFENFKAFVDGNIGTEALPSLPRSFAEAACMLSEQYQGYWKSVGVPKEIYREYVDFKNRMAAGLSPDKYRGTFWVYVMIKNAR